MSSHPKRQKMSEGATSSTNKKEESLYFDFSTDNFSKIVKTAGFVDKTLLLKPLLKDKMILITAPRRFGKSTIIDMVKRFLEIEVNSDGVIIDKQISPNRTIFEDNNLLVFQQDVNFFNEHFATYPMIYANFKTVTSVTGNSFDEVLDQLRSVLQAAFKEHKYLLRSDKLSTDYKSKFEEYSDEILYRKLSSMLITTGLKFLSECLHQHFNGKKVFVLIDEYDAPINNTMFEKNIDITHVNKLLDTMFSSTLKQNKYVERALLTGISYFATVGLSGVNNIEKYQFLTEHPFVPYYGLTEEEFDNLLMNFKIDNETKKQVKSHYNGYISFNGIKMYSIWSVLKFLKVRKLENFWETSGVMVGLEEAINLPVIRKSIEKLYSRQSVLIEFFKKIEMKNIIELKQICLKEAAAKDLRRPDIFLNFLLQQGYLTTEKQDEPMPGTVMVKVPNDEIIDELQKKLFEHYCESLEDCIANSVITFEKIFTSSENENFQEFIINFNELINELTTKIMECNEDSYHCIMALILYKAQCLFITEYNTSGGGRPDLIVRKGKVGMIIELKYKRPSEKALNQMTTKYLNAFNDPNHFKNVTKHIFMGLNVSENNIAEISVIKDATNSKEVLKFNKM